MPSRAARQHQCSEQPGAHEPARCSGSIRLHPQIEAENTTYISKDTQGATGEVGSRGAPHTEATQVLLPVQYTATCLTHE